MNDSQVYVLISLFALAVVAIIALISGKKRGKSLSNLTIIAFLLIIAGNMFSGNHLMGYSLMGTGLIIAFIDIIKKSKY